MSGRWRWSKRGSEGSWSFRPQIVSVVQNIQVLESAKSRENEWDVKKVTSILPQSTFQSHHGHGKQKTLHVVSLKKLEVLFRNTGLLTVCFKQEPLFLKFKILLINCKCNIFSDVFTSFTSSSRKFVTTFLSCSCYQCRI